MGRHGNGNGNGSGSKLTEDISLVEAIGGDDWERSQDSCTTGQRGGIDRLVTRRLGSLFCSDQLEPVGIRWMADTYAGRFPSGILALFAAKQRSGCLSSFDAGREKTRRGKCENGERRTKQTGGVLSMDGRECR